MESSLQHVMLVHQALSISQGRTFESQAISVIDLLLP